MTALVALLALFLASFIWSNHKKVDCLLLLDKDKADKTGMSEHLKIID